MGSQQIKNMTELHRVQYVDAMYPDPDGDFGLLQCPIYSVAPLQDPECQLGPMQGWMDLTSAKDTSKVDWVDAGHMDCTKNKAFLGTVISDMQKSFMLGGGDLRCRLMSGYLEDILSSRCR